MTGASYLFLLTDVNALYASNPKYNVHAPRIDLVTSISSLKDQVDSSNLGAGSANGTGGMATKLRAAEIASAAGIFTVITSSSRPSVVTEILEYYTEERLEKLTSTDDAFTTSSGSGDEEDNRPLHTLFCPSLYESPSRCGSPSLTPLGHKIPQLFI